MPRIRRREALFIGCIALAASGVASALLHPPKDGSYAPRTLPTFVNWETPQVHPIDKTVDGMRLLVTNTADNRLEVFTLAAGMPVALGNVPVGLDPVSVRPRTNDEVWVVNHISDSVSIVSMSTMNVVKTLKTLDEPCDVVFAGTPQRAFVTCGQANTVQVFDPANLSAAPTNIAIDGNNPRSLAVSPDGAKVYAAIFESGNASTILGGGGASAGAGARLAFPPNVVGNATGPYGGVNPPPNSGGGFSPPIAAANLPTNPVGLIVKKDANGHWMDDNNHDWTAKVSGANAADSGRPVGWDLPDHDLAIINTSTLGVTYATGLMNICMSVGINPATGAITVVGTDATNQVRFEPNVKGTFTRVNLATVDPLNPGNKTIVDLNPHLLPYAVPTIAQSERDKSIGDPRAVVWLSGGAKGYVTGMGSNNVIAIDTAGARADGPGTTIPVGEGPTGLCLDEARGRLYVLSKFAATISVINLSTDSEVTRVAFYDPSPTAIKVGRKHLYDTHKNSGLGQLACASCHVDARMDRLSWDLGDPQGSIAHLTDQDLNQGFNFPGLEPTSTPVPYQDFHPMKGPMTTQTLQDIIGHEPFHWRADRRGLENFGPAFMSLNGDDTTLTTQEMQEFEDFLATIYFPPNPNRNFDNTLPTSMPLPGHYATGRFTLAAGTPLPNGNAVNGLAIYRSPTLRFDNNAFACVTCHTLPTGGGSDSRLVNFNSNTYQSVAVGPQGQHHVAVVSVDGSTNVTIKIPQLRNEYLKTGFDCQHTANSAGFGVLHDGSVDSLERFVSEPVFTLRSDQDVADLVAFILSLSGSDFPAPVPATAFEPPGPPSQDTHAAVGIQTTLVSAANPDPGQLTLIASMISLANTNKVGLVVKGRQNGAQRGYAYIGSNNFQADHAGQVVTAAALQAAAAPGSELTYTIVVKGTETRIGIDRNLNGVLDFDEPVAPPPCGSADFNHDGDTGTDADIEAFFACLSGNCCANCGTADFNADGDVGTDADIESFFRVLAGGPC
jgi:DNA-binding beta-propeller fold protein YncE